MTRGRRSGWRSTTAPCWGPPAPTRAAASRSAPRDVASTRAGTAAFRLARHAPGLVDRAVAARLRPLILTQAFEGAELAAGLCERHGAANA